MDLLCFFWMESMESGLLNSVHFYQSTTARVIKFLTDQYQYPHCLQSHFVWHAIFRNEILLFFNYHIKINLHKHNSIEEKVNRMLKIYLLLSTIEFCIPVSLLHFFSFMLTIMIHTSGAHKCSIEYRNDVKTINLVHNHRSESVKYSEMFHDFD